MEKCDGCDAEISFVKNMSTGKLIPVQIVKMVYTSYKEGVRGQMLFGGMFVNHFEICHQVNQIHRKELGLSESK